MIFRKMQITRIVVVCVCLALGSMATASAQQSKAGEAGSVPAGTEAAAAARINLNTATAEQLEALPGIGPATAKNILEYRTRVGKFNRIEEIINVKGIGEKMFQKIKNRLTV